MYLLFLVSPRAAYLSGLDLEGDCYEYVQINATYRWGGGGGGGGGGDMTKILYHDIVIFFLLKRFLLY